MTAPATTPARCGVPWPVCPRCIGQGLTILRGRARCPSCGQSWDTAERVPCPDLPAVELRGPTGAVLRVCSSHAAHPSAAKIGGTR